MPVNTTKKILETVLSKAPAGISENVYQNDLNYVDNLESKAQDMQNKYEKVLSSQLEPIVNVKKDFEETIQKIKSCGNNMKTQKQICENDYNNLMRTRELPLHKRVTTTGNRIKKLKELNKDTALVTVEDIYADSKKKYQDYKKTSVELGKELDAMPAKIEVAAQAAKVSVKDNDVLAKHNALLEKALHPQDHQPISQKLNPAEESSKSYRPK